MKASATYTVKKWEEKPYDDISSDMKMTPCLRRVRA